MVMKRGKFFVALLALVALVGGLANQGDVSAATLTTRIQLNLSGELQSALDLVTASAPLVLRKTLDLANGTGANQANVIWSDQRILAASATEDLDLAGGGLLDPFGVAFAPAKVRCIIVAASSLNTNNVVLGGDVNSVPFLSTAATTTTIQPGGMVVFTAPGLAGYPVTAGTGDIIQVANSGAGTSVTYDVVVIGTSS